MNEQTTDRAEQNNKQKSTTGVATPNHVRVVEVRLGSRGARGYSRRYLGVRFLVLLRKAVRLRAVAGKKVGRCANTLQEFLVACVAGDDMGVFFRP